MIFGIVYIAIVSSHRQNMAMIEAGLNPKEEEEKHNKLRNGLLILFVPIGILLGNMGHGLFGMAAETAAVVFAFLFGGLAMVLAYFIEDKKNNREF